MSSFGHLFTSLYQCGVSHLGVGLPASLRAALPWCSSPFVGVGPYLGVRLPTSLWAALLWCWIFLLGRGAVSHRLAIHPCCWGLVVIVGLFIFLCSAPRRHCHVVMSLPRRLSRSLLTRLDTLAFGGQWGRIQGNTESEPRQKLWLVFLMHCVGLPLSGSPLGSSFPYPSIEGKRAGPHPYGEGRGTGCETPCLRRIAGGGGRKNEPRSTVDAVDLELKLRSDPP